MTRVPVERLRLVLVTDRRRVPGSLADAVAAAVAGGVTAVMLREKDLPTDDLCALGAGVRDACRAGGALFLVNGDVAAARRLRADGVHLGSNPGSDVGSESVRAALGAEAIVGRSTHDTDELDRAVAGGADWVVFGPVWDTESKRGILAPRGAGALASAVLRAAPVPVVALGGVTPERAAVVRASGAAGIAAIGGFLGGLPDLRGDVRGQGAPDPRAAAVAFTTAWDAAGRGDRFGDDVAPDARAAEVGR